MMTGRDPLKDGCARVQVDVYVLDQRKVLGSDSRSKVVDGKQSLRLEDDIAVEDWRGFGAYLAACGEYLGTNTGVLIRHLEPVRVMVPVWLDSVKNAQNTKDTVMEQMRVDSIADFGGQIEESDSNSHDGRLGTPQTWCENQ